MASWRFLYLQDQRVQALPANSQIKTALVFPFFYFDLFYTFSLFEEFPMFTIFWGGGKKNPGPNDSWSTNTLQVHSSFGMAFAASPLAGSPSGLGEHKQKAPGKGGGRGKDPAACGCPGLSSVHTRKRRLPAEQPPSEAPLLVTACRDWPCTCTLRGHASPPSLPGARCAAAAR